MMWRSRRPGTRDEALLVALAERLRRVARSVEPRADFRSSLRTTLVMEASTALTDAPAQSSAAHPARFARVIPRRRMTIAAAFVATALGLGSMASASASALPGETLYPVKRATEQVELTFHRGLADRGAFRLELAERRLEEARALSERGPEFADLAEESVRAFEEAAAAGTADLVAAFREDNARNSLVVLNRFTARTDEALNALGSQLPTGAASAVDDARDRLETIDSRSEQLCPTCGGGLDNGTSSPAGPNDSVEAAPEPEPEPEAPTSAPQPLEPSAPVPSDSPRLDDYEAVSENDDSDGDSDDDSDGDGDGDSDEDAQSRSDEPGPGTTPEPTPEPTPSPEPEPTPSPEPTEPASLLGGVGTLLGDVLGGL
jgi:hypothetical protein